MTRTQVIKNALNAISHQRVNAKNQLRLAGDINDKQMAEFWHKEINEHETTYQGLLDMLTELSAQGVGS